VPRPEVSWAVQRGTSMIEGQNNTAYHLQGFVLLGGGGSGPSNMEPGGTYISMPLKHTDVVDLEVEDSDSISSLEIVEPAHDVAEVFSPPRLTRYAPSAGLQPGQAFDLVDGVDLVDVHGRALVRSYLNVHRPRCVILSPPCTYFNKLMHISKRK
jgi:hypothetical protein